MGGLCGSFLGQGFVGIVRAGLRGLLFGRVFVGVARDGIRNGCGEQLEEGASPLPY